MPTQRYFYECENCGDIREFISPRQEFYHWGCRLRHLTKIQLTPPKYYRIWNKTPVIFKSDGFTKNNRLD